VCHLVKNEQSRKRKKFSTQYIQSPLQKSSFHIPTINRIFALRIAPQSMTQDKTMLLTPVQKQNKLAKATVLRGLEQILTAKILGEVFEANFKTVAKYVHAVSRGHEAVQVALAMQLLPQDFLGPYYRDDAMMLTIGITPYEMMLNALVKRDEPFSGGRNYYCHCAVRRPDMPTVPILSAATGMQAIPMTGVAMGIRYCEQLDLPLNTKQKITKDVAPIVVCSFGDASMTEGEVSEALQMAALKQLPILFLVQDNGWDISATAAETRSQNAAEYAEGFKGIEIRDIDGADFETCYRTFEEVIATMREERRPFLVRADVPLLTHHTSGVRKEWYRDDLAEHQLRDPYPCIVALAKKYISAAEIATLETDIRQRLDADFQRALAAPDPDASTRFDHIFAPTPITEERGQRHSTKTKESTVMVDCALHAIEELMHEHPECLLYGQDVGGRLGGVFREAATLAQKFGDLRVFNTPIQEAFIVGSTVGMSAAGLRPIVEVQFADYLFPAMNQLFSEVSRSCYLSGGKFPVSMVLRVPIGAYGGGGPYHSSSVESMITPIRGLKIAYPSNGADLKGLLKAAYYDPNPCIIFEHKGLYWSKVAGTETAKVIEPSADYVLPFGKANIVLSTNTSSDAMYRVATLVVVTYGMGVHWALNAAKTFDGVVEIVDLRTLAPLDTALVFERVRLHGRCLVLTEEAVSPSFAQSLAAQIQEHCFEALDAPVRTVGAENLPAVALHEHFEQAMLPNVTKVHAAISDLLAY
jgi:2-oxoisovalerate dehydrogenase E1 component